MNVLLFLNYCVWLADSGRGDALGDCLKRGRLVGSEVSTDYSVEIWLNNLFFSVNLTSLSHTTLYSTKCVLMYTH